MRRVDALPERTRAVLLGVTGSPAAERFILIGGTALAVQVGHRISEDVDLVQCAGRLDRRSVDAIVADLRCQGFRDIQRIPPSDAAVIEFDGDDVLDHQQDWTIEGVKLTFFAEAQPERQAALERMADRREGHLRYPGPDGIFELKSRLLVSRNTARDLYDVWYGLDRGGHTMEEVVAHALMADPYYTDSLLRRRLLPERLARHDPGFKPLLTDGPQNFAELRQALQAQWEAYEVREAERVMERGLDGL